MGVGQVANPQVRKAVIPIAGFGTRLLPATKVVRKEMLPVGTKPLIQHAVEEARSSRIEHIIFVCRPGDVSPLAHFQPNTELDQLLRSRNRVKEAEQLAEIGAGLRFSVAWQPHPLGLADAIRSARAEVDGQPFGVILPDALILGAQACLEQLIRCFMRHGTPVVATRPVAPDETRRYGILDIDRSWTDPDNAAVRARGLVEKPDPERAPSLYGVYGRYVLPATIFEFIDRTPPDKSGEIQITDALNLYCESDPVYGAFFAGNHYDTGNWKGYAEATMACFANELGIEQNSPLQSYH